MGLLRDIFGPSKDQIWSQLAAEVGGEFKPDGMMKSGGIRCAHRQWEFVLDTCVIDSGKRSTQYTRMRAPFVNKDGLYLKLYRKDFLTGVRSFFGMHDIEIGDEYFDEQFVIKGNNAAKIRQLLADPTLKQLIDRQPRISLEIKDDEGLFGAAFPDGVDELVFLAVGVMKDMDNLKGLFELFARFLDDWCESIRHTKTIPACIYRYRERLFLPVSPGNNGTRNGTSVFFKRGGSNGIWHSAMLRDSAFYALIQCPNPARPARSQTLPKQACEELPFGPCFLPAYRFFLSATQPQSHHITLAGTFVTLP